MHQVRNHAALTGGRNICAKVPPARWKETVAFYTDLLGLPALGREDDSVVVAYGAARLWLHASPGHDQSESWLETYAEDVAGARERLATYHSPRADGLDPLGATFDGFWIADPAGTTMLVTTPEGTDTVFDAVADSGSGHQPERDEQPLRAGTELSLATPPEEWERTVEFYRSVLGLPELTESDRGVRFRLGPNQLRIPRREGHRTSGIRLTLEAPDLAAARTLLAAYGPTRADDLEPLGADTDGFWITDPAGTSMRIAAPATSALP